MKPKWDRVPYGAEAPEWNTFPAEADRSVLLVVHNVTAASRLLDVVPVFDGDHRISLAVTCPDSSPFADGVSALFAERGLVDLDWSTACKERFGLALSASHGGPLWELNTPIIILPHGMGYNKYLAPGAGSREPGAGSREPGAGSVFGLSEQWVLHDGEPIAVAQILSHSEQLDRFRASAPTAADTAVIAGDPSFDRLLESRGDTALHRAALGLRPGRRLVVVNTTWGPKSLFGRQLGLVERLVAELPVDEYLVAAVIHPNVVHAHGRAEVDRVLAHARRGGLLVVPPFQWHTALLAADAVVGDHGSVSFYAAALGIPTMLAAFPAEAVDPESPIARHARIAPRLDPVWSLRDQIEKLMATYDPAEYRSVTGDVSSFPGRSLELLRTLFYNRLGLPEPGWPASPSPVPVLHHRPERVSPLRATVTDGRVERFPMAVDHAAPPRDGGHVVVVADRPAGRTAEMADVLVRDARDAPPDWAASAFARLPGLTVAALVDATICRMRLRDGTEVVRRAEPGHDPAVLASALYAEITDLTESSGSRSSVRSTPRQVQTEITAITEDSVQREP